MSGALAGVGSAAFVTHRVSRYIHMDAAVDIGVGPEAIAHYEHLTIWPHWNGVAVMVAVQLPCLGSSLKVCSRVCPAHKVFKLFKQSYPY